MNFQLTTTQQMTRRAMREFVRKEVLPLAHELDESAEFPLANYRQALELGIMDMTLPESIGGTGEDFLCFIIALEEFAYGSAALAYSISVTEATIHLLYRYGSRNQHRQYIDRLQAGEVFGATSIGVSVADIGNAGPFRADSDGNGYRLNGTLPHIPHASLADLAIVFATTGTGQDSAFIVERQMAGFRASKPEALMGVRSLPMGRLELNDVRVTRDYLLGGEGMGRSIYDALILRTQAAVGAIAVGISQAALEEAVRHSKGRVQFGKPLAEMQATQNKIADIAAGVEATRLLVYQAAFSLGQGVPANAQTAEAKLIASDLAVEASKEAVQIHGGYGYIRDFSVERLYRDAVFAQIYPTTNETQRINIAQYAYRTIR